MQRSQYSQKARARGGWEEFWEFWDRKLRAASLARDRCEPKELAACAKTSGQAQPVQSARESKGLSVAQSAERAGLTEGERLDIENALDQDMHKLAKAADVLDKTVEWLEFGRAD